MTRLSATIWLGLILLVGQVGRAGEADGDGGARTWYVDSTGDDGSAGSASEPWHTLQHAVRMVAPGDTVIARAGKYAGFIMGWDFPQSGADGRPITFKGEKGAMIKTRNNKTPDGINLEGCSYIVIDGFTINNDAGTIGRAGIRSVQNSHVIIRNNIVDGCNNWGIFTSHSDYILIENNVASHSHKQHGIYVSNTCIRPTVRFNRIFGNRNCGLHLNGDISMGGNGVITGALIENNIIYDNGASGGSAINCDGVQDSRIENNLLYNNHASGISLFKIDAAAGATNNVIVNNTIIMASNARWAINIKNGSTGNTVYNNILYNQNPSHGSINIDTDCLEGFVSDYNSVDGRFSDDDGDVIKMADWRNQTGQDQHSFIASPAELFVNVAGSDYRLAKSSPAIGAGISLSYPKQAPTVDLTGNARPGWGKWSLGACLPTDLPPQAVVPAIMMGNPWHSWPLGLAILLILACAWAFQRLNQRGLNRWLLPYCAQFSRRRSVCENEPVHLLLCVADHFELHNGGASDEQAMNRLRQWTERYPALFGGFRDSDGRPPRHTFFFPIEQYDAVHVEGLASLCRDGFGEVEIHLHHDGDTSENLRQMLMHSKDLLASRHGLLARHRKSGEVAYAFVHGNWALDNSAPDGRKCGVNNELDVLRETGCYADFTLPSAPDQSQTWQINSLYYASDDPHRPKSHNTGIRVGSGPAPINALMLIQGPLVLDWGRRKWGLAPRIENACIQENQPASLHRLNQWLRARIQVPQRPDWFFVKLHAHGANEAGQRAVLGEPMEQFHRDLARRAAEQPNFHYHYVTAREMYNLVRAAESVWTGSVADARDFELIWNGQAPAGTESRHRDLALATGDRRMT